MSNVVTVSERKARETERLKRAADGIIAELTRYATLRNGRYLVFGSVAAGAIRPASDFDVVVDFPEETERAAIEQVEAVRARHGMHSDVHSARTAGADFLRWISERCMELK